MAQDHTPTLASIVTSAIRRLARTVPVPVRYKQRLQSYLFQKAPSIFSKCPSYSEWKRDYAPIDYDSLRSLEHIQDSTDPVNPSHRIVLVTHDAKPHGAQFLALGMVKMLVQEMHLNVEVVTLGGGRLRTDFGKLARVHELHEFKSNRASLNSLAQDFAKRGFRRAVVNSAASGRVVPVFKAAGIESVCLVHELPGVIRRFGLEQQAAQIAANAAFVVFPAQIVADGFGQFAKVDTSRQLIRPQGLYRKNKWRTEKKVARSELRKRLSLSEDRKIVLTVGFADHRKGVDLFVECAIKVMAILDDVDFVWVGHWDEDQYSNVGRRLAETPYGGRVHFVGYDPDTSLYHAASDLYLLTSREDPFPNVVLESFDVAVPVVAFSSSGGAAEFVEEVNNVVVPFEDVEALSSAICTLLNSPETRLNIGRIAQEKVDHQFSFGTYMRDLCELLYVKLP
jgi:glycosyltransferase involved in cell wall biosynthesis